MEKNAAENNEFKKLIKNLADGRIHKRNEAEIFCKKLPFSKKKALS